jgi:hypothetical protein
MIAHASTVVDIPGSQSLGNARKKVPDGRSPGASIFWVWALLPAVVGMVFPGLALEVRAGTFTVDNQYHEEGEPPEQVLHDMAWAELKVAEAAEPSTINVTGSGDVGSGSFEQRVTVNGNPNATISGLDIRGDNSQINGCAFSGDVSVRGHGSAIDNSTFNRDFTAIGTNLSITASRFADACLVYGDNNAIGGSDESDGNYFYAAHAYPEGYCLNLAGGSGTQVRNNTFGLDGSGQAVANVQNGLVVDESADLVVADNTFVNCAQIPALLRGATGAQFLDNRVGITALGAVVSNCWNVAESATGEPEGAVMLWNCADAVVEGNVIVGSARHGLHVEGNNEGAPGMAVRGNFIGVKSDGATAAPNAKSGIYAHELYGAGLNPILIGGGNPGEGNVVSGNAGHGVKINYAAAHVRIQGNKIGTDTSGTLARGNGQGGVYLRSPSNCVVGGLYGAGNLISGNTGPGLDVNNGLYGPVYGLRVQGNTIGANAAGTASLPNTGHGIAVNLQSVTWPGAPSSDGIRVGVEQDAGERNLIRGNGGCGLYAYNSDSNLLYEFIVNGNFIAGNQQDGIQFDRVQGGTISSNRVGLLPSDEVLGNSHNGINLGALFASNIAVEANSVAGSGMHGVRVGGQSRATSFFKTDVRIGGERELGNSVGSNGLFGIYVCASGVDVQGNDVGLLNGQYAGNAQGGIRLDGTYEDLDNQFVRIGGANTNFANVVVGPLYGVLVQSNASPNNVVSANFIGYDPFGEPPRYTMLNGIRLLGGTGPRIGLAEELASCNYVGGTTEAGLFARAVTNLSVERNLIGCALKLGAPMTNSGYGVWLENCEGPKIGHRDGINLISGNGGGGVYVTRSERYMPYSPLIGGEYVGNVIGLGENSSLLPNGNFGMRFIYGHNDKIGGDDNEADRNIIAGNRGPGIELLTCIDASAKGNRIGVNHLNAAFPNEGDGIRAENCEGLAIGSANAAFPNVISANAGNGICVVCTTDENDRYKSAVIAGNVVGLDGAKTASGLGNGGHGISIANGISNTVGSAATGGGNWIASSGGHGILVTGTLARATAIYNNRIGMNEANAARQNEGDGIRIAGTPDVEVGQNQSANFNVVGSSGGNGVALAGASATNAAILGNYIGTRAGGNAAIGPIGGHGILVSGADFNAIGQDAGRGNVVGNCGGFGILVSNANRNAIGYNHVGVRLDATATFPNALDGVRIDNGDGNDVQGNVVGGSGQNGITVAGLLSRENVVRANHVGTSPTLVYSLANAGIGIDVWGASETTVGGTLRSDANCVFNNREGIRVATGTNNPLLGNLVHASQTCGIVLTNGGNAMQAAPVIADATPGSLHVAGYLQADASKTYRIEYFLSDSTNASGAGEGRYWLGASSLVTDETGRGTFSETFTNAAAPGMIVTATATAPNGNTSAFSAPATVLDADSAWDAGYQNIGGGWRRLNWFGDFVPMGGDGWIWHNMHGFFFVAADALPESIWMYAMDMGWLWTANGTYPFLFRNSDGSWLWYNGSTNPRWFANMTLGTWEHWP